MNATAMTVCPRQVRESVTTAQPANGWMGGSGGKETFHGAVIKLFVSPL